MFNYYDTPFSDELLKARNALLKAKFVEKSGPMAGHSKKIARLVWNSSGSNLATGSSDSTVRVWNNLDSNGGESVEFSGHLSSITDIAWNPTDDRVFASTSTDKTLKIWDTRQNRATSSLPLRGDGLNLTWSCDGKHIVCGHKAENAGMDNLVIVDATTSKTQRIIKFHYILNEMAWMEDGKKFLIATGNGEIEIRQWPDFKLFRSVSAHTSTIFSLDMNPNGSNFVVGGSDAIVSVWDAKELVSLRTMADHSSMIRSVSISPGGNYVASAGSEDPAIFISHINSGAEVHRVNVGPDYTCVDLAWHPKQNILAYALSSKERHFQPTFCLLDARDELV